MRSVLVAVSELDRSIRFYTDVANLHERLREDRLAVLGDESLLSYLYLREASRGPTRQGQDALGVRAVSFDVPSVAELDRIEAQLGHLGLLRDRHRLDGQEGLEFVRGYDPDRLPLVFVSTDLHNELSVATLQRVAGLLYGVDL
jgi:catechol 2,3-dioxygenase-like lactoylglutathione lyase family enzyme